MEDRDFFDLLYQEYTKTTGAENTYWMVEEDTDYYDGGPGTFIIWSEGAGLSKDIDAVNKDTTHRKFVASLAHEADADFITALHGCFPDLTRRLHSALDEADRLDTERDARENEIADLAREISDLRILLVDATHRARELETTNEGLQQAIREMEYELEEVGR